MRANAPTAAAGGKGAIPGAAGKGAAPGAPNPAHISKEMEVPSTVMGHIIGQGGKTIAEFRNASGVHVQVSILFFSFLCI